MKVKYMRDEEFSQSTWLNENEKGQVITIRKGDIFETGAWGRGGYESVLTKKGEWICDVYCKEFNELFEMVTGDLDYIEFYCPHCGKKIFLNIELEDHEEVCTEDYNCSCGKGFKIEYDRILAELNIKVGMYLMNK